MIHTKEAFVLQRYKETGKNAVLTLLTAEGSIQRIKIHGIYESHHRSRIITEPGVLGEFTYYEKGDSVASCKEFSVTNSFEHIRATYQGLLLVSALIDLTGTIGTKEKRPSLFFLLKGSILWLNENASRSFAGRTNHENSIPQISTIAKPYPPDRIYLILFLFFKTRILLIEGLVGDLDHCSSCQEPIEDACFIIPGELSFHCKKCKPEKASKKDFLLLNLFEYAIHMKFRSFLPEALRTYAPLSDPEPEPGMNPRDPYLELNLHLDQILESYTGRSFHLFQKNYDQFS